jgi:hypothetical protein
MHRLSKNLAVLARRQFFLFKVTLLLLGLRLGLRLLSFTRLRRWLAHLAPPKVQA